MGSDAWGWRPAPQPRKRLLAQGRLPALAPAATPLCRRLIAPLALLAMLGLAACQTAPRLGGPGATGASHAPAVASAAATVSGPAPNQAAAAVQALPPHQTATARAGVPAAVRLPRLGLALGGGAARGFAHIGVLQVLEEAGIRADLVVGTSAGSLVAALFASGKSGADIGALAQAMDEGAITDWAFPGRGVLRGDALARWVRDQTGGLPIERLARPLGIVATDLDSGAAILFQRGDTGLAVRASSAVPAVFQPVRIGNREYVDGGLVSPVPVRFARQMGADVVLAVDISVVPEGKPTGDMMGLLLQTFAIMGRSISQVELRDADVVLRPALADVGSADFSARVRAILAGRDAAKQQLPALKARLAAWSAAAAAAAAASRAAPPAP